MLKVTEAASGRSPALDSGFIPTRALSGGARFDLGPVPAAFRHDDGAVSREVAIGPNPHRLQGNVKFTVFGAPGCLIQDLTLTATSDLTIEEIVFVDPEPAGVLRLIGGAAGSGTCLQELYIAPHLLTPPMWDALTESITRLHARRSAFADVITSPCWLFNPLHRRAGCALDDHGAGPGWPGHGDCAARGLPLE